MNCNWHSTKSINQTFLIGEGRIECKTIVSNAFKHMEMLKASARLRPHQHSQLCACMTLPLPTKGQINMHLKAAVQGDQHFYNQYGNAVYSISLSCQPFYSLFSID